MSRLLLSIDLIYAARLGKSSLRKLLSSSSLMTTLVWLGPPLAAPPAIYFCKFICISCSCFIYAVIWLMLPPPFMFIIYCYC